MSMRPGTRNLPLPSTLSASAGICTAESRPASRIRPPATTTTELLSGGPPKPSIRTAPMMAFMWLSSAGLQAHERTASRTRAARGSMNIHNSRAPRPAMQYNLADMTPENAAVVEPQPAGMGELARLTGVFFEPGRTFADVAQRPSWFVPMLLTVLFGLIFCVVVGQRIGWDNIAMQQMEKRMAKMTPDQREQAMKSAEMSKKITPIIAYAAAVVGPAIGYLISAL